MHAYTRNYIIAVVVLGVFLSLIILVQTAARAPVQSKKLDTFPMQLGSWQGKDIPLEEDVYEILGTRDVIVREYKDPQGNSLVLAVIYSSNDRSSFHPPEICYLGGGIELRDKGVQSIPYASGELTVNALTMEEKKNVIKAWYWFAAGPEFTHSFYRHQLMIMRNWLRYKKKEGALIRVSARIDPQNPQPLEGKALEFIGETVPFLEKFLRDT